MGSSEVDGRGWALATCNYQYVLQLTTTSSISIFVRQSGRILLLDQRSSR